MLGKECLKTLVTYVYEGEEPGKWRRKVGLACETYREPDNREWNASRMNEIKNTPPRKLVGVLYQKSVDARMLFRVSMTTISRAWVEGILWEATLDLNNICICQDNHLIPIHLFFLCSFHDRSWDMGLPFT